MCRRIALAGLILSIMTGPTLAQGVESQSRPMDFERCLRFIQEMASAEGMTPINVVENSMVRIVRFPAADGSVLVTCSKPDRKIVITRSPFADGEGLSR